MTDQLASDRGFLTGDKVILRGMRRADLEFYRAWFDNADITYYMEMGARPLSNEDLEEIYQLSTERHDNIVFTITEKMADRPIGVAGIYAINWICRRGDFRIIIGEPNALGKGLGTAVTKLIVAYGFEKLNLEVVTLGCNAENKRAIRSYENAGFVHEGRRRKMIYRNSRYYDILQMSILRDEYFGGLSGEDV